MPSVNEINRRSLLKLAGFAGAGALAGCIKYPGPKAASLVPDGWLRGEERWVASTCQQCPSGCGIQVRVHEGRAIKLEGSPGHPLNQGGLGPKGQAGLQVLYHPDRVRGPLRRKGPRGSGQWEPVAWDAAIAEIAAKLRELRDRGEPESLVVLDGEPRGLMPQLWERFLAAYGSPNHVDHRSKTGGGKYLAMHYMQGAGDLPAYDWKSTRYVLGFGASLFESWCQTIHLMRAYSAARRGTPGRRVKFVQVSPHFTVTAAKADQWVPIEPATYGALALGLAHVLVKETLYDQDFVREHSFGFDAWTDEQGRKHRGFRELVTEDYAPDKVARITGVASGTIVKLAREMHENRPAVAIADGGAAAATNGLGTAMAIHALNALLGNLERPGGLMVQKTAPLSPWKDAAQDAVAKAGRGKPRLDGAGTPACPLGMGRIQDLPEAILAGSPYPAKALLLYRSNPAFSCPGNGRWIEALKKVPLVVSFSPLPDESTFWADYVLPDPTYLERWELVEPVPSVGHPMLGLRQPVVEPVHDTLATGDLMIRLAKAIGGPVGEAFPWGDYRGAAVERLRGVLGAQGGSIRAKDTKDFLARLSGTAVWSAEGPAFEQWAEAFRTPSGRFEFYSQALAARLAESFPDRSAQDARLESLGVASRGDELCLPHWEPPRFEGDPAAFPFILVPYRGLRYAEGGMRQLPLVREIPTAGIFAWRERVDLHPHDAKRLGIREGDDVRVESPAGGRRLCARVHEGVRPGTLGLPLGGGTWPPAPSDPEVPGGYGLLANSSDPLAGILALQCTRARIRKEGA